MTFLVWLKHTASKVSGDKQVTSELFRKSCCGGWSPLLWRVPILLWSLGIFGWSAAVFWGPLEKFFLYMTHWGLLFIVLEAVFGIIVSIKAPIEKSLVPGTSLDLPWYVRVYWLLYNITVPVAFLITVFYWCLLKSSSTKMKFAPDPVLDVMLHAVNSAVMMVELVLSAHPSRLLDIMQPLFFAGAYLLFSVVYYYCGGLDPWGNHFIYPVIDWSKPKKTVVVIALTGVFLALMHIITVIVAALRDLACKYCSKENSDTDCEGLSA